jgi:hypothetical protein
MYERKVKKGPFKDEMGWGCPLCFLRLPDQTPKSDDIINMIESICLLLEQPPKEKPFDFWKKPSQSDKD